MMYADGRQHSLKDLDPVAKIFITGFLLLAGIGYLLGFFNILLTYSLKDSSPGLSLKDIEYAFYGKRTTTTLEKAVDGDMKRYFTSDADYQTTKDWLAAGAGKDAFDSSVKPIFDMTCTVCHSSEAGKGQVVTQTYTDLEDLLKTDTGKSIERLVAISHTHLLPTLAIIFILNFIFYYTSHKAGFKKFMAAASMGAVFLDIGSWWLAKLAPFFSTIVLLGGMTFGLSFLIMILGSLYDMYIPKKPSVK